MRHPRGGGSGRRLLGLARPLLPAGPQDMGGVCRRRADTAALDRRSLLRRASQCRLGSPSSKASGVLEPSVRVAGRRPRPVSRRHTTTARARWPYARHGDHGRRRTSRRAVRVRRPRSASRAVSGPSSRRPGVGHRCGAVGQWRPALGRAARCHAPRWRHVVLDGGAVPDAVCCAAAGPVRTRSRPASRAPACRSRRRRLGRLEVSRASRRRPAAADAGTGVGPVDAGRSRVRGRA